MALDLAIAQVVLACKGALTRSVSLVKGPHHK